MRRALRRLVAQRGRLVKRRVLREEAEEDAASESVCEKESEKFSAKRVMAPLPEGRGGARDVIALQWGRGRPPDLLPHQPQGRLRARRAGKDMLVRPWLTFSLR